MKQLKDLKPILEQISKEIDEYGEEENFEGTWFEALYDFLMRYQTMSHKPSIYNFDTDDGKQLLNYDEEIKSIIRYFKTNYSDFEYSVLLASKTNEETDKKAVNNFQDLLLDSYLNCTILNHMFYNNRDLFNCDYDNTLYDCWSGQVLQRKATARYVKMDKEVRNNNEALSLVFKGLFPELKDKKIEFYIKISQNKTFADLMVTVERDNFKEVFYLGYIATASTNLNPQQLIHDSPNFVTLQNIFVKNSHIPFDIFHEDPKNFVERLLSTVKVCKNEFDKRIKLMD